MFEEEWTALQTCVSCFGHSSRGVWPSQRKWFTTWSSPRLRDAEQLLILWRTHSLLMCVSLSRKIPSDWTFSWTKRVLTSWTLTWTNCKMKFDEPNFCYCCSCCWSFENQINSKNKSNMRFFFLFFFFSFFFNSCGYYRLPFRVQPCLWSLPITVAIKS